MSDSLPDVIAEDVRKWARGIQFFSKLLVYNYLTASKMVNELVRSEGFLFDITIAHDWLSAMGGIAIKRELGMPFAFHVHSTEKGRTMGNGSEVVSNIELRAAQTADIVVTVSNAMRDELIGLGFPAEKIRVVYNGVDPQKYSLNEVSKERVQEVRARYGLKDDDLMILFLGRLVWIKGADKLIAAMPHVLQKIPNAKLVIVGSGDMQDYVTRLAQNLKIQDHVKFCFEFIPEEDRIAHYAACDVAVFPSVYEPFGIVAIEAMSMEKPVVVGASGVSGMREIVIPTGPEQCGFHINPNDPTDIAWGIIGSLENADTRRQLGLNGRKRVLKEFTWDEIAKKTIRVYSDLIEPQKPKKL